LKPFVTSYRSKMRRSIALGLSFVMLHGCASEGGIFDPNVYDPVDSQAGLVRADYENMMSRAGDAANAEAAKTAAKKARTPMPQIAQILAAPKPPKIGKSKLVSLTVTDDVPLKDVLIELARLAEVDIELGPGITGGVSFIAKDKPFSEVIARLSDLAGLRYNIKGGVLRVERDVPYVKNYPLDFLNIVRNSSGSVTLSTDVLSISAEGGEGGLSTGTSASIDSTTQSDFWDALESSLLEVLNWTPDLELTPDVAEAVLGAEGEAAAAGGSDARGAAGTFYVINRQAGILTIAASERQHARIREYLHVLKRSSSAQVLIEAKILEVELDKQYQSGIDWTAAISSADLQLATPSTITDGATISLIDSVGNLSLDTVVQLAERFGASRTLSSPRLHAVNNQQAVLTFAENQVFFEVDVQREDAQVVDGVIIPGATSIETTRRSVPIGIVLNILPSINLEEGEVTLSVRPTLTRQTTSVTDPGSAILNADLPSDQQFVNEIPIIEVRELDSVMKLKSGSVMVIGGLMEEISNNVDTGIPGLSSVPWLGNAFKSVNKINGKRELIIFIKATIVSTGGSYDEADRHLYEKFSDDHRPLVF
jgi:hypothetical protein